MREFCWRKRAERIKILAAPNAVNLINLPCDALNNKVKGQSLAGDVTFHLQPRRSPWGPSRLSQLPAASHNEIGHSFQRDGEHLQSKRPLFFAVWGGGGACSLGPSAPVGPDRSLRLWDRGKGDCSVNIYIFTNLHDKRLRV